MALFSELKRRNVRRTAVLYVVAAWLLLQVALILIELDLAPASVGPLTFRILAIAFPIALLVSWYVDITPAITLITERRMDFIVIALLSAAVILFAYSKSRPKGTPDHSIAVLPFTNMNGDPEQEYFSDGISEELLILLAQCPEFRDDPRFVELMLELDATLATERDKVLKLICFKNPTPENWQPLPKTCEGVEERPES